MTRAMRLLEGLDHLVVQDMFLTRTAEMAHVVLPAAASWCEDEGTVTSSERRVQRVRKALEPPGPGEGRPRDPRASSPSAWAVDWGRPTAEQVWDELRSLSSWHGGMSYERLEELDGLHWPCPDESHPGSPFLHGRLWKEPIEGPPAPFSRRGARPAGRQADRGFPDPPDDRPAARLLQHRRADGRLHLAAAARRDARHRPGGRAAPGHRRR